MNALELNDIVSLKNGNDYIVINILKEKGKVYFLLALIDEYENPDMNHLRVVEEIEKSGKKFVKEIYDKQLLKELEKLFSLSSELEV